MLIADVVTSPKKKRVTSAAIFSLTTESHEMDAPDTAGTDGHAGTPREEPATVGLASGGWLSLPWLDPSGTPEDDTSAAPSVRGTSPLKLPSRLVDHSLVVHEVVVDIVIIIIIIIIDDVMCNM